MLKLNTRHSTVVANILAAIVLTIIVNFSYLISMIVDQRERDRDMQQQEQQERERYKPRFLGRLHVSPDGYGYLIAESDEALILPPEEIIREMLEQQLDNEANGRDDERGDGRGGDRGNGRVGDGSYINRRDGYRGDEALQDGHDHWYRYRSDSIFVNQGHIFIFNLQDGDLVMGTINRGRNGSNPSLDRPLQKILPPLCTTVQVAITSSLRNSSSTSCCRFWP